MDITLLTKNLIYTAIIIGGAFATRLLAGIIINRLVKRLEDGDPNTNTAIEQRAYTLASLGKNIANVFIYGAAIVTVLSQWGINIAPILTGAGIIGLAVGFGAQTLVKDIVTGFFIILENQYNVGDRVEAGSVTGKIIAIKLRTTIIKDDEDNIVFVPNSSISTVKRLKK